MPQKLLQWWRAGEAPQGGTGGMPMVPKTDLSGAIWSRVIGSATPTSPSGTPIGIQDGSADNIATGFAALNSAAFMYGFDGTTWDRIRSFAANADNITPPTAGALATTSFVYGFDGTTYDRIRSSANNADALAALALGNLNVASFPFLFNGTTFDRSRTNSAPNLSTANPSFAQLVAPVGNFSINHTPAAATQATISRAAGGAGFRHVCTSIGARLIIPPTVNQPIITLNLRDGATGAGTILWSQSFGVGAATVDVATQDILLSGLSIFGTANTAMTLEFSAAGAATTVESVAFTGYTVA